MEFGVEIGEYRGVVQVPRRVFRRPLPERSTTTERCAEAFYPQRTGFESIADRNLRRRELTEDGKVEIKGARLPLGLHPYISDKIRLARQVPKNRKHGAMLNKDILFGMNILTLAGFVVMGLSLTLHRRGAAGRPLSIGLMCAGTALVFLGLYAGGGSR